MFLASPFPLKQIIVPARMAFIYEFVSSPIFGGFDHSASEIHGQAAIKTSKVLQKNADKKSGNFSDARASFFVGLSMKIGVDTGKNNGIERG
jgi:hypothetical protein